MILNLKDTRREPMRLGDLIAALEGCALKDSEGKPTKVWFDFGGFTPTEAHSYRGIYAHLALGFESRDYDRTTTLPDLLADLRSANGKFFVGYKGGSYLMSDSTPVWVSNYGEAHNTAVSGIIDLGWRVIIETRFCD